MSDAGAPRSGGGIPGSTRRGAQGDGAAAVGTATVTTTQTTTITEEIARPPRVVDVSVLANHSHHHHHTTSLCKYATLDTHKASV